MLLRILWDTYNHKLFNNWFLSMLYTVTLHKCRVASNYWQLNNLFNWLFRLTIMKTTILGFNHLRPRDAYMRQENKPSLVQIMACRLVGAKPLSEPKMEFCQLNTWESKFKHFHSTKLFKNVVCEIAAILSRLQCVNDPGVREPHRKSSCRDFIMVCGYIG